MKLRLALLQFSLTCAMGFRLSGQTHVPAEPVKNPPVRSREAVQAGRVRYQRNCGACHGVSGQGGRGPKLANAPRLRDMTDEKIFEVIRDWPAGRPGAPCSQ